MDALKIEGGVRLAGEVQVSGSKNASLPIMAAALLAPGNSVLLGAPDLADVRTLGQVLGHMGAKVSRHGSDLQLDCTELPLQEAPYELVSTCAPASWCWARCSRASAAPRCRCPGGCAIGARPVDQHLKGLEAHGRRDPASSTATSMAEAPRGLRGAEVVLRHAHGDRHREPDDGGRARQGHARRSSTPPREPEVEELGRVLNKMGAASTAPAPTSSTSRVATRSSPSITRSSPTASRPARSWSPAPPAGGDVLLEGARAGDLDAAGRQAARRPASRSTASGDTVRVRRATSPSARRHARPRRTPASPPTCRRSSWR